MLLIAMPSFLSGYQLDDFYLGYTSPREYGGYLPAMPTFDKIKWRISRPLIKMENLSRLSHGGFISTFIYLV